MDTDRFFLQQGFLTMLTTAQMSVPEHAWTSKWSANAVETGNTDQRQKKNKPARVMETAMLTFQGLHRYVL